jgi:hypothetical protein
VTEFRGLLIRSKLTGQWRWKVLARNNRSVAVSGESYRNRLDCIGMFETLFPDMLLEVPV